MALPPDPSGPAPVESVVDLNSVVEAMWPLLIRVAGSFIRVERVLDPADVGVAADSDQVEQVLLNLVVRASDAMPLGGKLVIATRRWRLARPHPHAYGAVPAGRWAVLEVAGTGARLEVGALAELSGLTPSPTGAASAGSADLAKVASIVRRAAGHVLIEDGEESGTAVAICFPLREIVSRNSRVSDNTPAILVVDGDAWMQTTTAHLLRRAGYGVLQADHISGALELLRGVTGSCVRVMLIDADLPGDDARTLARAAQRLRADLQVIHVGRARAGSSEDLLTKPFTADELLRTIGHRLGAPSAR